MTSTACALKWMKSLASYRCNFISINRRTWRSVLNVLSVLNQMPIPFTAATFVEHLLDVSPAFFLSCWHVQFVNINLNVTRVERICHDIHLKSLELMISLRKEMLKALNLLTSSLTVKAVRKKECLQLLV